MSVVVTLSNDLPRPLDKLWLVCASLLTTCLVAGTLWMATPINRLLGTTGINVATRVMALIVGSLGINFITAA